MKTEIEPKEEGEKVLVSRHLSPLIHAANAGLPGEAMVTVVIPRKFIITLSDGSRQRVEFPAGTYDVPKRLANHGYLEANGGQIATTVKPVITKAKVEDAIDRTLITDEFLGKAKMDQLKSIFGQLGGDVSTIGASASKVEVAQMIRDKIAADEEAASK